MVTIVGFCILARVCVCVCVCVCVRLRVIALYACQRRPSVPPCDPPHPTATLRSSPPLKKYTCSVYKEAALSSKFMTSYIPVVLGVLVATIRAYPLAQVFPVSPSWSVAHPQTVRCPNALPSLFGTILCAPADIRDGQLFERSNRSDAAVVVGGGCLRWLPPGHRLLHVHPVPLVCKKSGAVWPKGGGLIPCRWWKRWVGEREVLAGTLGRDD